MATIVTNNTTTRYNPHSRDNGLKLMEHSYLKNNYCKHIMSLLEDNLQNLIWLCDYHKPDSTTKLTWNDTERDNTNECLDSFPDDKYYILNHTQKLSIDVQKLLSLYKKENKNGWFIHPIPILCNSDTESQGGGDYRKKDLRRATWCKDEISTSKNQNTTFKDITNDVLFYE